MLDIQGFKAGIVIDIGGLLIDLPEYAPRQTSVNGSVRQIGVICFVPNIPTAEYRIRVDTRAPKPEVAPTHFQLGVRDFAAGADPAGATCFLPAQRTGEVFVGGSTWVHPPKEVAVDGVHAVSKRFGEVQVTLAFKPQTDQGKEVSLHFVFHFRSFSWLQKKRQLFTRTDVPIRPRPKTLAEYDALASDQIEYYRSLLSLVVSHASSDSSARRPILDAFQGPVYLLDVVPYFNTQPEETDDAKHIAGKEEETDTFIKKELEKLEREMDAQMAIHMREIETVLNEMYVGVEAQTAESVEVMSSEAALFEDIDEENEDDDDNRTIVGLEDVDPNAGEDQDL